MNLPPPLCSTAGKLPLIDAASGGPDLWVSGSGPRFVDRRGRSWLDFDLCLGTVVWGHGRPEITAAVAEAVSAGSAPSIPSLLEGRAAELLLRRLRAYETARFFKTGGDSCAAAVRLARCATGRDIIASDGYHGWHDWGIAGAYPDLEESLGVPEAVRRQNLRLDPADGEEAVARMAQQGDRLAAAIVRPEAWEPEMLARLSEQCRRQGAILIADEVTSHFKYSRVGSAAALGVTPDMICVSKGLANGLPLAALLGPRRLVDLTASARISSTNSSETASLAAMIACEGLLSRAAAWPVWGAGLARVTAYIHQYLQQCGLGGHFSVVQHPGFFSIERPGVAFGLDPFRRHVVRTLGRTGIYSRGWFHGSDAHGPEDWRRLQEALIEALRSWLHQEP